MPSYEVYDSATGNRVFFTMPRRGGQREQLTAMLKEFRRKNAKHVDSRIVPRKELPAAKENE